jgi:hypothetical protein
VLDLGILSPREISITDNPNVASRTLRKGMVGWIACAMKDVKDGGRPHHSSIDPILNWLTAAYLGDTFHHTHSPMPPLETFKPLKSMVFAGVYPLEPGGFPKLEDAIRRVRYYARLSQRLPDLSRRSSLSPTAPSRRIASPLPSSVKASVSASMALSTWTFSGSALKTNTERK